MPLNSIETTTYLLDDNRTKELVLNRYFDIITKRNCDLNGLNTSFLEQIQLAFLDNPNFPKEELLKFSIPTLIDYLKRTHKLYLHKYLPEIGQTIQILHNNYTVSNSCLLLLNVFFKRYAQNLAEHINEEESILFPYINNLLFADARFMSENLENNTLQNFLNEHIDMEEDLRIVQMVLKEYEPNSTNKSPYRILLNQLETFELDLNIHKRVEEEVLMAKVLLLEINR